MVRGFAKNMAKGMMHTKIFDAVAAVGWIAALIGALVTSPVLYAASVVQIALIQRRVGSFGLLAAVVYPVSALVFVGVMLRSALAALGLGRISWAGRRLP